LSTGSYRRKVTLESQLGRISGISFRLSLIQRYLLTVGSNPTLSAERP
jgi:hypothetical protein